MVRDSADTTVYSYDANGNRIQVVSPLGTVTGTYDGEDRLQTYGGADYTYNNAGQLTQKDQGGQVTSYTYDVLGNLTAVTLPDSTQISYLVDGQGRRIGKRVNGVLVQGWLWQGQLAPVAELDGSGQVVSRFVYGTRVNVPDYMERGGATYRLVTNHLGSVELVVDASTGEVVAWRDYDEWGRVVADSNPDFQPFGFAGGLHEAAIGLTRFGSRDYDAVTGRWLARDPIGFSGGQPNLYEYVWSTPVNLTDPAGETPWGLVFAAADVGIQLLENGGRWGCVNWGEVGISLVGGGLLNALAKGAFKFKTGSKVFNSNWRRWFRRNIRDYDGVTHNAHHWWFERNQGWGQYVDDAVKNQPWNVNIISAEFNNWLSKHPALAWLGGPSWAGELVAGGATAALGGAGCGCD